VQELETHTPEELRTCPEGHAITVQVLLVVFHEDHVGPGHDDVRVCVIDPLCPTGQERVCVSGEEESGEQPGTYVP